MKAKHRPVVLVVLDGWGEWDTKMGNPMTVAKMPLIDTLNSYYPKLLLEASGLAVGLPWGVFGNSEVGHQTMGSGQIIYSYLPTITAAIQSKRFFRNKVLLDTIKWVKKYKSRLHLVGLLSDAGVHSHFDHLLALLEIAKSNGLEQVFVHVITDGRDTPTENGVQYLDSLLYNMERIGIGKVASIVGRYYTMDRNKNWDRVEKGFLAYVRGEGIHEKDPRAAIEKQYKRKKTDEFLEPIVMVDENNQPIAQIQENDAVINFNYRSDRARQISQAFIDPDFDKFSEVRPLSNIHYVGFTRYQKEYDMPVVFAPQKISTRVGEVLSSHNKKQLRIAETEKYAHVTYFFNGGLPKPFPGEDRIFVPSKNAPSYAVIPEMSAYEVTDKLIKALNSKKYDFVLVNYANTDMVGHTGDFRAGIKTLEVVDQCLDRVIKTTLDLGGCLLVTADHGNIEEMINLETGQIDTQHSTNPVPFWLVSPDSKKKKPQEEGPQEMKGIIADIAPTVLELCGIKKPVGMLGVSLFDRI